MYGRILLGVFVSFMFASVGFARFPSNSAIIFRPSLDGGRYFSTDQSQGLYSGGYNAQFNLNYAFEPVEVVPATGGGRVAGVVNDLLVGHFTGAFGITDWFNIGLDFPVAFYETFFNYINVNASQCVITRACPKQTKMKLGDVMVAAKFRIINSDRSPIGISVQPFALLPTGSGYFVTGYGQFSGGAKLIFDLHFKQKFFISMNVGYQMLDRRVYSPDTAHAIINDQILFSAAANVPFGRDFAFIAEIFGETLADNPFTHVIQSPVEFLGGFRYSPGHLKHWSFSLGGGTGMDKGFGASGFRGVAQINYRKTKVVELETPEVESPFEEKIVIMQKIHFEFDRWNIRPVSFPILDDVVDILQKNPQILKVRVEGHTDWKGTDAYNDKLSMRRSHSVRTYLIQKGIDPSRLEAAGYGESKPVADNNTDIGRAKNRRTEFTILESR